MTTKIQSGAYRAAVLLNSYPEVSHAGMSLANHERMVEEWSKIIERETVAPELLEALEDAARECRIQAGAASHVDDAHGVRAWSELQNKLDAAIRKARSE